METYLDLNSCSPEPHRTEVSWKVWSQRSRIPHFKRATTFLWAMFSDSDLFSQLSMSSLEMSSISPLLLLVLIYKTSDKILELHPLGCKKLTDSVFLSTLSAALVILVTPKPVEGKTEDPFELKAKDLPAGCKQRANHAGFWRSVDIIGLHLGRIVKNTNPTENTPFSSGVTGIWDA